MERVLLYASPEPCTYGHTPQRRFRVGTLFSALDIGRAGLHVAQVNLDVTGHNIANVNTDGYSRQRANVLTRRPNITPEGAIGRGPYIAGVERIRDPFLDTIYRNQVPGLGQSEIRANYFDRMEAIFQEPGDNGFGARMGAFFDSLNDFANNVEELPVRVSMLSEAGSVASTLREVSSRLSALRTTANEEVRGIVPEINSLSERIAMINSRIETSELGGREASDLRDERDVLLDDLAELVNIQTQERSNGVIDVFLGGDQLIIGRTHRELETGPDPSLDPDRTDLLTVRFADDGEGAEITSGELAGAIQMRDEAIAEVEDQMDTLARALMLNINRIHSSGNGIDNFTGPLSSTNGVDDPNAPLNSAGLPFPVQDGSFDVVLYDDDGNLVETRNIAIDETTSLNDIAAQIDGSAFASVSVDANGILTVTPNAGNSFVFANDTSDALPALGMNVLFTGSSASDIAISAHLEENPNLLSSGYSLDPAETGDNSAALEMASLRTAGMLNGDTQSVNQFFQSVIVELGIDTRRNLDTFEVERSFVQEFDRRREEVSGVNLDEEVTNLLQFQRAYEASARIITVADRMLETLMGVAR